MSDTTVNPNSKQSCPECGNIARLKEWVFIEETFDGIIFQCPQCNERMNTDSMKAV